MKNLENLKLETSDTEWSKVDIAWDGLQGSTQITPLKEIRDWKVKYQKAFESNEVENFFALSRQGRPSKMSDKLTTEVKSILHNLRVSGGAVTWKTAIAIGNEVLKARCTGMLEENGGSITLTTKWARGVAKSLDWVKRRYTTSKREMNLALYEELTFSWKKKSEMQFLSSKFRKK